MSKVAFIRVARPILLTAVLLAAASIGARDPFAGAQASDVRQAQVVGEGGNRAGIVVRFDDGRVVTRCVAFSEPEIGGDELLARSGLNDVVIAPEGTVCRIDGLGCPSDDCFCKCPFPECIYWAYYHRQGSNWIYSQQGAVFSIIRNGSLDGWSWGQGNFQSGVEPPDTTFDQVCPADLEPATATVTTESSTPVGPPQATFSAAPPVLAAGQCASLNWQTVNANTVTLEGATVGASGSQQVCPPTSQTWTLVASNNAGQTTRQVSVQVRPAGPSSTVQPGGTPVVVGTGVSVPATVQPLLTGQPPQPLPTIDKGQGAAAPGEAATLSAVPVPTAGVEPSVTPSPQSTATRYLFSGPPTETPRPRRELGAGGRPTPTAILMARAGGNSGQAAAEEAANKAASRPDSDRPLSQSRAFSVELIPGYIAYLVCLVLLLLVAWYVLGPRGAKASSSSAQPVDGGARGDIAGRKD